MDFQPTRARQEAARQSTAERGLRQTWPLWAALILLTASCDRTKPAAATTEQTPKQAAATSPGTQGHAAGAAKACGHGEATKGAPGCPGMPAAAAVLDHPEAAPAAKPGGEVAAAATASKGKAYGAPLSDKVPTVTVSALLANVDGYVGKRVRIEGVIKDVCPMRGCWMTIAGDKPGLDIRFKVRDGVMVFPVSAKGQYAVSEGVVRKIPLDLAQTKRYLAHQAEEKGEAFDVGTVTKAMTLVRLDGVGAVVRAQR